MKKSLALMIVSAFSLTLAACGSGSSAPATQAASQAAPAAESAAPQSDIPQVEAKTFRLGHSNSSAERDPDQYFAVKWGEHLAELSGGQLNIDVYGDAALGSEKDMFIMVKDNQLDMQVAATVSTSSVWTPLELFDLPYTVMNDAEYRALMYDDRGAFDFLREGLPENCNMHFFGLTESGARKLWGWGEAPKTVADLAGKKIRIADSAVHRMMWTMLGCNPANVAWSEVFSAHQQHVIDGGEWPVLVGNASGFYEVNDYVQSTDLYRLTKLAVMNKQVWDSLDSQSQEWLTEAYWLALDDQIKMIDEDTDKYIKEWEKSGCIYHDDFDKDEAYEILVPAVWDAFRDEIGADIMDKYTAAVAEVRKELEEKK